MSQPGKQLLENSNLHEISHASFPIFEAGDSL
jgi:hypothetical protein